MFSSPVQEESKSGESDESNDTSDNTCQGPMDVGLFHGRHGHPHMRDVGQDAPPAIAPTLVFLELPELLPPLSELPLTVGEGVEDVPVAGVGVPVPRGVVVVVVVVDVESVEEREITDGTLGVASGSLPAA